MHIEGNLEGLKELTAGLWQITGAGLQLEGVASERYAPEESYQTDVPRLRSREGKLEPAGHDVVVYERAAAYFDVYGGVLQATKTPHGAVGTELTVTIAGEPRLKVTCFWNRQPSWITLRRGAPIHVEHTGTLLGDADCDFLLHYLIFPSIPDDVEIPEEAKNKKTLLRTNPGDISAGCSNSQYP